ncbi:MAG: hypothetical protein Edafosvirus12_29 [Edafosvirus sp.]|uniref:Uncharacterized protein n=1 Tax=Edafosvirus sp. TaxID=2487765 RepID=A0A3G4ZU50_9VIRU|nr:MAG: hypothetical protein Edafosvirus12_29 [Edafosvirus sp.]
MATKVASQLARQIMLTINRFPKNWDGTILIRVATPPTFHGSHASRAVTVGRSSSAVGSGTDSSDSDEHVYYTQKSLEHAKRTGS